MEELYLLVIGFGVETEAIALVGVDGSSSNNLLDMLHEDRKLWNCRFEKKDEYFKFKLQVYLVTGLGVEAQVMALVGVALRVV